MTDLTSLVVTHRDADVLAQAVAARAITAITDAQAARGSASIVLTGGGIGGATLRAVAASALRDTVDWGRLDVWWGDERFLPAGHPERNETQARDALLDHVPVDPVRVRLQTVEGLRGEEAGLLRPPVPQGRAARLSVSVFRRVAHS